MLKLLSITIWLLTCAPGGELYSRYGHTAIRVQDTERDLDVCFNYGTFSFDTEHFYWKFVKGETYYMLSASPTEWFKYEYRMEQRAVFAQELNLTQEEARRLEEALVLNCQPEHAEYLYNFVFDNCSTRPFKMLQKGLDDPLESSYEGWTGHTYRQMIRHYTHPHSVINGLINLIFGKRSDIRMQQTDAIFLPEQLMFYVEQAHKKDGSPLVKTSNIAHFHIVKARWWETIYPYLLLFAAMMTLLSLRDRKRNRLTKGVDIALGGVYVVLIALVVFLRFFSIHPMVGFDIRLMIIPMIHLCTRLIYICR